MKPVHYPGQPGSRVAGDDAQGADNAWEGLEVQALQRRRRKQQEIFIGTRPNEKELEWGQVDADIGNTSSLKLVTFQATK